MGTSTANPQTYSDSQGADNSTAEVSDEASFYDIARQFKTPSPEESATTDVHDDLAVPIVAETFSDNDNAIELQVFDDQHGYDVDPEEPETTTASDTIQTAEPVAGQRSQIEVGQLVDDITKKLMPEIEWKVRVRLREILDEIFPNP